jgi:hypothetical protein
MKLRIAFLLLLTLLCLMTAIPASGQLYSNGPYNGNYDAYTINFGYIVSETFTLGGLGASTVTGFDFYSWSDPGDTPLTIDWSITAKENGGTVYGFGYGASITNTVVSTNSFGYQINYDRVGGLNVNLDHGVTYWLNLQNATTKGGNPLYWDENDGPSLASSSGLGTIGSETFAIHGGCSGDSPDCAPPSPEPSSILLFGSGVIGLAGLLRRKLC